MGRVQKRYIPWDWKPNAPIKTLICDFEDKKSGRVSVVRKEIRRRFEGLDWKDQKHFLHLCLDSCVTDRQWAYGKLCRMWDSSFEEKVKSLWEETHESFSQWPVIQHFSCDYLLKHIDEFTGERDYYFICRRFATEVPDFEIDKSRLSAVDYLILQNLFGRELSEEEAYNLLYGWIAKLCVRDLSKISFSVSDGHIRFKDMDIMIKYLEKLGHLQMVYDFDTWNTDVAKDVLRSLWKVDIDEKENIFGYSKWAYREWIVRMTIYDRIEPRYLDVALTSEEKAKMNLPWGTLGQKNCGDEEKDSAHNGFMPSFQDNAQILSPHEFDEIRDRMASENPAISKLFNEMGLVQYYNSPF